MSALVSFAMKKTTFWLLRNDARRNFDDVTQRPE